MPRKFASVPQKITLHQFSKIYNMFKSDSSVFGITLHIEVRMPILIKVKGYTRVRNGKVEKVNSYYRRVWGR